jgi:hypothetical protein
MPATTLEAPDAVLFIASGCSHCPVVLEHLGRLVKEGAIGRLEVVNIGLYPELAVEYGVRSVPWYRIADLELSGARGLDELRQIVAEANLGQTRLLQLEEYLAQHRMDEALGLVEQSPALLHQLIPWLGDLERPFDVRIGIGALLEGLQSPEALDYARAPLEALLASELPQVRADACHYLGVCRQQASIHLIRILLDDPDASVREIAVETLALMGESE